MKEYYYLDANKQPQGPLSTEDLIQLEQSGRITPSTLVARKGESTWKAWSSFEERSRAAAPAPKRKATPEPAYEEEEEYERPVRAKRRPARRNYDEDEYEDRKSFLEYLSLGEVLNNKLDRFFDFQAEKILTPVPDKATFKKVLLASNSLTVLLSTIALFLCGMTFLPKGAPGILTLLIIIGAIVGQYLIHHVSKANSELAMSGEVQLSTTLWPRIFGLSCYFGGAALVIGAFFMPFSMTVAFLLWGAFGLIAAAIHLKSSRYFVKLGSENMVGGLELISIFRYILRSSFVILQIEGPLLLLTAIIVGSAALSQDGPSVIPQGQWVLIGLSILPVINYIFYILLSFIPDILESLLSRK